MLHAVTIRFDTTQFTSLSTVAKTRGISVAEAVRQSVAGSSDDQTNLLALLASEIDDQRQQLSDQQATLAAILAALENLAALRTAPPQPTATPRSVPNIAKALSPDVSPAPKKIGTGESWQSWIVRQPFAEEDSNSPSARARRVWRQFEEETGNDAPPQFRSSAPSQ